MGIRELARQLGLSPARICQLAKAGMPTDSDAAAREWRLQYVAPRPPKPRHRSTYIDAHPASDVDATDHPQSIGSSDQHASDERTIVPMPFPDGDGDLDATLKRLHHLERVTATTLERLLSESRVSEAAALRREYSQVLKSVYDCEVKKLKFDEARGRLVTIDTAWSIIAGATQEALLLLRQLPGLAKTPEERGKLETFLAAVLNAFKDGATEGMRKEMPG